MQNVQNFFDSREKIIDFFRDYSFLLSEAKYETNYGSGLKILTTKQTLQRLPMALAQVKAGNTSKNLLNEIRQIIYSLYQEKEVTKKVYNNIMNSIKLENKMNTIFVNSKNSGTSDPCRLLLNVTDKINIKRTTNNLCCFIKP